MDAKVYKSRFSVQLRLSTGEIAALWFDYLKAAIEFAKRTCDGDWAEVVDTRTGNCMWSTDRSQ